MKKKIIFLLICVVVALSIYFPTSFNQARCFAYASSNIYQQTGIASWYGKRFHGRKTACGERYNMFRLTAAHRNLPFGSIVRVRNLSNGKEVTVRINDRGPYIKGRIIDLSLAAACKLRMVKKGITKVRVEVLGIDI